VGPVGGFSFSLGNGSNYEIPGFMVWMAVLYCGVGSVLTHYIGRPQIALNFQQQKRRPTFATTWCGCANTAKPSRWTAAKRWRATNLTAFGTVLANYLRLIKGAEEPDLVHRLLWPGSGDLSVSWWLPRGFSAEPSSWAS
jgi:ABC-type uncharacterized transport system fused permease/ATPase subunit